MAIIPQAHLFDWQDLDAASDLDRFRLVLLALPDEPLVRFLERRRGHGRDDYPVRPTWNAVIAGIVFQHVSSASLLRELSRNAELRQLCGFDPALGEAAVPTQDAFGRFLALLIEYRDHLTIMFHQLVDELHQVLPDLGAKTAIDSTAIPSHGKPVGDDDKRTLWKGADKTRPLYPNRVDSFVYDEDGHVYCLCPTTTEQRELAFCGFESERGTLKYRCPAAACGLSCAGRAECQRRAPLGVGDYGRVIRVPLELDRRIFTPIARTTAKWDKTYDRRTAVERVNARLDRVLGFELHFIRGADKMQTRITLALIVMLAMALGRIRVGQADQMRSLVAPVRRAA
jgi:hypothetical protein